MGKTKTYEDAQTSQTEAKENLATAKKELQSYYKDNKLKKGKDYSEDKKHGKKVTRLTKNVEKAQSTLEKAQEETKSLKPQKERTTKYDYPADIDTAEKRKKYRQEMRAKASGKTKKEKPAKAEKTSKKKKKTKVAEVDTTKSTKKSKKDKSIKKKKKAKKNKDD